MSCRLCLCKIEDMLDPEFATTRDSTLMEQIRDLFGIEVSLRANFSHNN